MALEVAHYCNEVLKLLAEYDEEIEDSKNYTLLQVYSLVCLYLEFQIVNPENVYLIDKLV